MDRIGLQKNLGAAAPQHHQPGQPPPGAEIGDVGSQLKGQLVFVRRLFDVGAGQPAHVVLIKDRLPRPERAEFLTDGRQPVRLKNAGVQGRLITVVRKNIPAAKDQRVQVGQRHTVLNAPGLGVCPRPQAAVLGQTPDRPSQALLDQLNPGNQGRADGPHAGQQNTEFAPGWHNAAC